MREMFICDDDDGIKLHFETDQGAEFVIPLTIKDIKELASQCERALFKLPDEKEEEGR